MKPDDGGGGPDLSWGCGLGQGGSYDGGGCGYGYAHTFAHDRGGRSSGDGRGSTEKSD